MKRLLQVFDWFLYVFGLAGLAAMTTLAVMMPPHWPIITALLLAPPIITAVLLLLTPLVLSLGKDRRGRLEMGTDPIISANRRKWDRPD